MLIRSEPSFLLYHVEILFFLAAPALGALFGLKRVFICWLGSSGFLRITPQRWLNALPDGDAQVIFSVALGR